MEEEHNVLDVILYAIASLFHSLKFQETWINSKKELVYVSGCVTVYVFCVSVLQKRAAWGQSHKNRAAQAQCAKNCSIGGPWLLETEWIGFSNFFLVWTRMQNLGKSTRCMAKSRLASKCNIFEAWPEKDVFFGLLWISPVSVCPPVSVWPLRWLTRDLSIADTWGNQLTCHFLPIELYNWL